MKLITLGLSISLFCFTAFASTVDIQVAAPQAVSHEIKDRTVDYYSFNFGRVWINSSRYASYKLTNTGSTPLTFSLATISGIDYSATHTCAGVLAPNQECRFDIRYSPFFVGFNSGRFVLSFVEDLDLVVDLFGEGYRP